MVSLARIPALLAVVLLLGGALLHVQAAAPGNEHFERRWARTDAPVADGATARTWIWGPEANTGILNEEYADAPGGKRQVQYYDKSRMEINDPSGDPSSPFYVTNGLLVIELMTGRLQLGDDTFEQYSPAQVNVAGDPDDPLTYADLAKVRNATPVTDGSVITQTIDGNGTVGDDPALASHAVTAAHRVQVPGIDHQVASVFWDFLNATGPVMLDGQMVTERLFEPWFYATGYPVTEAYWAEVKVGGTPRQVLLQCFERRCLTYTPGNPAGFEVEAGNVGQHYYRWRYPEDATPTATATVTTTATVTATGTTTGTVTATATNTPTATVTPQPATDYVFDREWGGIYTPIGRLSVMRGVGVDTNNNLWVADSPNHRLVQFDPDGVFLRVVGAMGANSGEFQYPTGVAASDAGNLYVADRDNHRIQVLSPDGEYLDQWGKEGTGKLEFRRPHAIAIRDNVVYVAEAGNHRIQMFTLEGAPLGTFASYGTSPGQFDTPLGLAFDPQGNVFVTDGGNDRVQKFDPNGTYLSQFGSEGSAPGQFDQPEGIAIDADGYIYVADNQNDRVQVFSPGGGFLGVLGENGNEFGQFRQPAALALDNDGNLYVGDELNLRVQKFSSGGAFLFDVTDSRRGRFSIPTDIEFDESGGLLVIDGHSDMPTITQYTLDGVPLETYGFSRTGGQYDILHGVAVGAFGDIYVTDRFANRIQRFSERWVYKGEWGTAGSLPGQFNGPTKIATDADGNVYVTDTGNNRVQKFDSNGVFLDTWGGAGSGNGQFKAPEGIVVDGDRVYVTDYGNDRVQVFTRDGQYIDQWGSTGSDLGQLKMPVAVDVRSDGYVLVVDYGNSRVVVYTPDGEAVDTFGKAGSGPGQFNVAFGIAIDDDDNVYVTDVNNDRVQKFALRR
jgi:streptogramin lyase